MDSIIQLDGVGKTFGGRRVLDGIDWEVRKGQNWAVLGLNGSGKTTLLRIATGRLWPTDGKVSILGRRIGSFDLRDMRERIGWVSSFLNAQIPPSQTALDTIAAGARQTAKLWTEPGEKEYERAEKLAVEVGIAHLLGNGFASLSQGERQLTLIARALMPDPPILVLDEPCIGLDMHARERFLESIGDLKGPTLFFVTHHIEEIVPAIGHAMVLDGGRVLAQGKNEETMTSDILSAAFRTPITVSLDGGRFIARLG